MRDAFAIVKRLLEVEQPGDEQLDWEPDPSDPDEVRNPSALQSATDLYGSPEVGEPMMERVAPFRERARPHGGGYMQPRYGRNNPVPRHFTLPHGTRIKRLDNKTFAVFWEDGSIGIQLHGTVVLKRDPQGNYQINTAGYKGPTTVTRLDEFMPYAWKLFTKPSEGEVYWFNWSTSVGRSDDPYGRIILFTDGDVIKANSTLVPQAEPVYRRKKRAAATK